MFEKTPKTVAEAVAPLKTVAANLAKVRAAKQRAVTAAEGKIDAAARKAEQVAETQGKVIDAATAEADQAEAILANLEAFLNPKPAEADEATS